MKNIEQRKQTILKVCQSIVRRQTEFLEFGLDHLRPMMIKEIAEEIGVHPSTVSRAVLSSKYRSHAAGRMRASATSSPRPYRVPAAGDSPCFC